MNDGSTWVPDDDLLGTGRRVVPGRGSVAESGRPDGADRAASRAGRAHPRADPGPGRDGAARGSPAAPASPRRSRRIGSDLATRAPSPERLGDYLILRRIGGGGMGVVYEAEHESLRSRVALKVMHPRFRADARYLRRFHSEARLAAGLHHTNIVGVFDYGEQDGVCYYAMQFIEGQPLEGCWPISVGSARTARKPIGRRLEPHGTSRQRPPGRPSVAMQGLLTGRFVTATDPCEADVGHAADRDPTRRYAIRRPMAEATESATVGRMDRLRIGSSSLGASGEVRYYREVARIGAQVADALDYAHRRGVSTGISSRPTSCSTPWATSG